MYSPLCFGFYFFCCTERLWVFFFQFVSQHITFVPENLMKNLVGSETLLADENVRRYCEGYENQISFPSQPWIIWSEHLAICRSSLLWELWQSQCPSSVHHFEIITCTLDSGKLIFKANSSLMNTSGYLVFWNRLSRMSSCCLEKVVLSLLCFLTVKEVPRLYMVTPLQWTILQALFLCNICVVF